MEFDYRTSHYNRFYLLKLWEYLYFSNEKSWKYFKRDFSSENGQIQKIDWYTKFRYRGRTLNLEEVEIVKEQLSKMSVKDLEILIEFIELKHSDRLIIRALKYIWNSLVKLFSYIISATAVLKLFEIKRTEISVSLAWFSVILIGVLLFIWISFFILSVQSEFAFREKRMEIESVLPKLIKNVIEEKQQS